jgi:hypothetical protein
MGHFLLQLGHNGAFWGNSKHTQMIINQQHTPIPMPQMPKFYFSKKYRHHKHTILLKCFNLAKK